MRKILWMISGIVSAFLSGMFLYEGGKLFFWFYDRRGGVIVLAAGCAVFILFIWSMIRFFGAGTADDGRIADAGEAADEKERNLFHDVANEIVFGCAAGGIILYLMRLYSTFLACALAAGVVLLAVAVAAVRLAVSAFIKSKK